MIESAKFELRHESISRPCLGRARAVAGLSALGLALLVLVLAPAVFGAAVSFDTDWRFRLADATGAEQPAYDDRGWASVTLPHPARIEALVVGRNAPQWQGVCWYRKSFVLAKDAADKEILLRFEGAMNAAEVWVNGRPAGSFMGGYLPYVMDISSLATPGATNVVAVRLYNGDNPITGPKPLSTLDFNLYSGLYRGATLSIKDKLHITDSLLADRVAGGGVFVTYPAVSASEATVRVSTDIRNSGDLPRTAVVRSTLLDAGGTMVTSSCSTAATLAAGAGQEIFQEYVVAHPRLWSPGEPNLYRLKTELLDGDRVVDAQETRIGIRRIEITADGFRINGRKMFLRGVNRHQEYPYIGNAVPDAAQFRDALRIKEAGFDFVRLSHYPQSPAFLDACDELGLVVMDSILGWQYFGRSPEFRRLKLDECRRLIRRDRNHPSIALWEVSLNETAMPASFIERANAIAHEEYPGDQCYTCGWMPGYDVFIQARQAGGCRAVTNRACMVSEYGDWEYYAQNAGLQQDRWSDLGPAERNSRQLRGDGEVRMLQQAMNFQEAHNDNLATRAFADAAWVMFDYNRGYAPDLEASGVMDIFRLPKFSYWFYRSQRDPAELVNGKPAGPVLFVANDWTPQSPLEVRVFGNCDEVALFLNDKLIDRHQPDRSRITAHLKHPPFTFRLERFEPGTLRAIGYAGGREVARFERRTPGEPVRLALRFDTGNTAFPSGAKDAVFCYADILDAAGTVVPTSGEPVFFGTDGASVLVGHNPIQAEAGTAAMLVESEKPPSQSVVYALGFCHSNHQTRILSAAAGPNGSAAPDYEVRYTADGSEPGPGSPVYEAPIRDTGPLRAAIFVGGRMIASADSRVDSHSTHDRIVPVATVTP